MSWWSVPAGTEPGGGRGPRVARVPGTGRAPHLSSTRATLARAPKRCHTGTKDLPRYRATAARNPGRHRDGERSGLLAGRPVNPEPAFAVTPPRASGARTPHAPADRHHQRSAGHERGTDNRPPSVHRCRPGPRRGKPPALRGPHLCPHRQGYEAATYDAGVHGMPVRLQAHGVRTARGETTRTAPALSGRRTWGTAHVAAFAGDLTWPSTSPRSASSAVSSALR